jgi:hypothetical protein
MRPPVVVVGMGGSGSRVVAALLREAGIYMGANTNGVKEDALEFAEFDYRWSPPYLAASREGLEPKEIERMRVEHAECVAAHLKSLGTDTTAWGWKHCPSGHLLSFIAQELPELTVIHVIRDGRDTAFGESGGRTHTLRLGGAVLDGDAEPVAPGSMRWKGKSTTADGSAEATPLRQARFWGLTNGSIADWQTRGEGCYLRIRLEDLVKEPVQHGSQILDFAGAPDPNAVEKWARTVSSPASIGRWRRAPVSESTEVQDSIAGELERFGYA